MPNIFIDPYLFACPKVEEGRESFEAYVNDLLEWKALGDFDWAKVYILRETYTVLANQHHYPVWNDLKEMIKTHAINYIQPDAIVTLVNSFLDKFSQIESTLEIIDILAENVCAMPSNHLNARPKDYEEVYEKVLIYMSLKSTLHEEQSDEQLIITTGISDTRVNIEAELVLVEFEDGSENETKIKLPLSIKDVFSCCKNQDSLILAIKPELMWLRSINKSEYKMCIAINSYIASRKIKPETELKDFLNFNLGESFVDSAYCQGFNSKGSILLRAISEILLEINLNKTHALREGSGGNDPQIEMNDYKAWRRDIDQEYHLHYWKKSDHIILACVVSHDDFNIPFDN